jgi:nucleotide-binding universal stress UspA family protein
LFEPPARALAPEPRLEASWWSATQGAIAVLSDGCAAARNAARRAALISRHTAMPLRVLQSQHAALRGAGLLVTHVEEGRRLSQWLLGTRIEQLLRDYAVPVLVVKQPATQAYRRVLVGAKLDAGAVELLVAARRFAPFADVDAVHVLGSAHEYGWRGIDVPQAVVRANRALAYGDAYRKLAGLIAASQDRDHEPASPRVLSGYAPQRLVELGAASRANLIVLGRRSRHWLADLLLDRGMARTVVDEGRSDVLLVPPS